MGFFTSNLDEAFGEDQFSCSFYMVEVVEISKTGLFRCAYKNPFSFVAVFNPADLKLS